MDIGLVLGGGGARGYAHIGVLQALEEQGLRPVAISGCSMGGLVGAYFAAGYSAADIRALVSEISFLQLLTPGVLGGLVGGSKFEALLDEHLPKTFEELSLPVAVTTVDVQCGELFIFRSGQLTPALRATSALPGIIAPIHYEGRYFIDGGLLNNLPVDVIKTMTHAPVVAVDVAAPPNRKLAFTKTEPKFSTRFQSLFTDDMQNFADNLKQLVAPSLELFKRSLTIELFMKSFDVPQAVLTQMRLAMHPPALCIVPELDTQFGVEDFGRLEEGIEAGYEAARAALEHFLIGTSP
ncbi:MAG: patatin-like phospholipase family protein [Deinococcota bacterium]